VERGAVFFFIFGLCVAAQAEGPLETRNHRALSLPFLRLEPRGPVLGPGERQLTTTLVLANDLKFMPRPATPQIEEDYEVWRLAAVYRQGLGEGTDLSVELPLIARWGGILDPFIDGFHTAIMGVRNERSGIPYGRTVLRIPGQEPWGAATGMGDAKATVTRQLDPRTQVSAALKVPTGDAARLLGSGAFDVGAAVQHRVPLGPRWDLHVQGGLVRQGRPTRLEGAREWVHQEALAVEWRQSSRDRWVLQWQGEASALVTGIRQSDGPHRILSLSYARMLSPGRELQLFASEDGDWHNFRWPEISNVGPDFALGVRLDFRF
jgi:hypothetical protein